MKTKKELQQRKTTFVTRSKSAIFIVAYLVAYFLLLLFSDPNVFSFIRGHNSIQCALGFLCIIMIVPVVYFVSREITNLCFPKNKGVFIYTLVSLFILLMSTSVFLLGCRYLQWWQQERSNDLDEFAWHLIVCLSAIVFFTFVSTLVWIVISRHIQYVGKKTKIWYPLLMLIINIFLVGFIYTTIIHGWSVYIFLMISAIATDVFAYIGGSFFGKHKLAPTISPKKTWEGLACGFGITLLVLCGIVAIFFIPGIETRTHGLYAFLGCQSCNITNSKGLINLQPYYWGIYIPVFILLMSASVFGDLFFSLIKRKFGIKDFSNLIPGHGGMLDRIDSIIFVFIFYFLITIIIQISLYAIPGDQSFGLKFLWTRDLAGIL